MIGQSKRQFSSSVYLWARGALGVRGKTSVKERYQMPKGLPARVEAFDDLNVKTLRVGLRHSAVITEDGQLYTFGNGNWGVLGHGNENDINFKKPKLVDSLDKAGVKAVDVQLGHYHTIVLDDKGQVWTFGYGGKKGYFNWMVTQEVGALGHGDIESHFNPKKVSYFKENNLKVNKICAGNYHNTVLTDCGNIYSWGRGLYGVLGNDSNSYALVPQEIEEFVHLKAEAEQEELPFEIKKIDAAEDYTTALTKDGTLYTWGKNDAGQCGVGSGIGIDMVESERVPKEIDFTQPDEDASTTTLIEDFSCGQATMLMRDRDNRFYKTGLKIDYTPRLIKFDNEVLPSTSQYRLMCGRKHYVVLDETNNTMHVFGNVFKTKAEEEYDGFGVYDCDKLFDGGKVIDLEMKYEVFGALIKH